MRFRDVVVTTFLVACGSDRPASVTDEMVATFEKDAALVRQLATELEQTKGDCKAGAAVVRKRTTEVAAAAKASAKYRELARKDKALMEWIEKTYKTDENVKASDTMRSVTRACREDADFTAAMTEQRAANQAPSTQSTEIEK